MGGASSLLASALTLNPTDMFQRCQSALGCRGMGGGTDIKHEQRERRDSGRQIGRAFPPDRHVYTDGRGSRRWRDRRQQTADGDRRQQRLCIRAAEQRIIEANEAKARTAFQYCLLTLELQVPGVFRLCFLYTAVVFLSDHLIGLY